MKEIAGINGGRLRLCAARALRNQLALVAFAVCLLPHAAASRPQHTLAGNSLNAVVAATHGKIYADFDAFLADVREHSADRALQQTIEAFQRNEQLSDSDKVFVYRLLGVFVRNHYADQLLETLAKMVELHTDNHDGVEQYDNPEIIKFGEFVEKLAGDFGLEFRNADDRVFEVILRGTASSAGSFGVYTHCDVVPANGDEWVLEDGTRLDPFEIRIVGDKIYGRGTEDDKGSIVAALYAMKAIRESRLSVTRDIRLIIETTEETGGSGIKYYKEQHALPEFNVVLDNAYPVVIAEKGFALISANFDVREASGSGIEIVNVKGAVASTQIPASATVTLATDDPARTKGELDGLARDFVKADSSGIGIESTVGDNNTVALTFVGVSAHSSQPETGRNPVPCAFAFLNAAMQSMSFRENHFSDATRYVFDNFGTDFYGQKMGVAYADDFMGPLTVSVTVVNLTDSVLTIDASARLPRGKHVEQLQAEIDKTLTDYRARTSVAFAHTVKVWDFMYRDPERKWIGILLDIYQDTTGDASGPISTGGGTTAKFLPEAVSFGPSMPGDKYMGHNVNEFKKIDDLFLDAQMITEMIMRLGQLHANDLGK